MKYVVFIVLWILIGLVGALIMSIIFASKRSKINDDDEMFVLFLMDEYERYYEKHLFEAKITSGILQFILWPTSLGTIYTLTETAYKKTLKYYAFKNTLQ